MTRHLIAAMLLSTLAPAARCLSQPVQGAGPSTPGVVSFASGASLVERPSEYDAKYTALMILDEDAKSLWATQRGVTGNQQIVISLAERTVLTRLVFDTASADGPGRGAKDIVIEVSDRSASDGFEQIAAVSLRDRTDNQAFSVAKETPGRWVRLVINSNNGDKEYVELSEFRAEGRQLTSTPAASQGGSFKTTWPDGSALMHIEQRGTRVTGCYDYNGGTLEGGAEGRLMRFTWRERGAQGLAIMVISPDGSRLNGLYWQGEVAQGQAKWWDGIRTAATPGACPDAADFTGTLTRQLQDSKRAMIYGINFDFGADRINDASRPTLDEVALMLKANTNWRITIEGHTDGAGETAANDRLSMSRAIAVKAYLVAAGIPAGRLSTAGFGEQQPVATNDSAIGRSQNRRVELVRD